MQWLSGKLEVLRRFAQMFGPYLLIEILLPGGSLIALLLFLHQHGKLPFGRQLPAWTGLRRRA